MTKTVKIDDHNLLDDNLEDSLAFIHSLSTFGTTSSDKITPRKYNRVTSKNNQFVCVTTSREFFFLFKGFTVESVEDIHDILDIKLNNELHYFLTYKMDSSNIDMDNYIDLPAYKDLIDDLSFYFNL